MSLYGALFTGVSSLSANSRALGIASNNIANVNTVGYKSSQAQFSTLLASTTAAGTFSSGGVRAESQQLVNRQGLLQISDSATDLAMNGSGFFVVSETPDGGSSQDLLFTRAGSFTQDADGYLRNAAGYYLQGWQVDSNGNIPTNPNDLTPINLNALTGTATASSTAALRANLRATETPLASYTVGDLNSGAADAHFERTIEVYDSQGGAQPLRLAFAKTGANTWAYEVMYDGNPANIGGAGNNPIGSGTLTFNTDGTLLSPAVGAVTIPWAAASGLGAQTVNFEFGTPGSADGVTQFDSASTLISSNVNGALFGGLSGVRIDEEGFITALFDNGVQQQVYKLPVATFQNPNGLSAITGNAYLRTDDSGNYTLLEAQTGGAGSISAAALEASTVDLAKEFTDLITTQRAYSAGTRIISTADQMLEELIRIKR